MKQVQDALANIGIPVYAGVWRAATAQQNPPAQYCVYSTTTTEAAHEDDHPSRYRTYVYLNLWSDCDPTAMRRTILSRMIKQRILNDADSVIALSILIDVLLPPISSLNP